MTVDENISKMTFACGIAFYNDHRSLKRCLDSVAGNFEYIFCLDGRYNYLKYEEYFQNPLSTDGSREVVDCYHDKNVILIDAPDLSESGKRQIYCDISKDYGVDVLLVLDSDEFAFCADWPKFRLDCFQKMVVRDKALWSVYNIPFREMDRPRLFFKPWELAYGVTHYELYKKDDPSQMLLNMGGDEFHLIDHVVISHKHNLRDAGHMFAHEKWELKQQQLEDHKRFGPDFKGLKIVKRANEQYKPIEQQ